MTGENLTSVTSIYSYVFAFERKFSPEKGRTWMSNNWTYGFYFSLAYVFLVFSIKYSMQSRPRFRLRKALIGWNVMLAGFSIFGAARTSKEMFHVLSNYGLYEYHSICISSFKESAEVVGFWRWIFALSKLVEMGDTIFVVLRKQPLIFLHWYHHITVLLHSWCGYQEHTAMVRWFVVMNYSVHSLMYSYYAYRAMGFHAKAFIMMLITSSQIVQMITGCFVTYSAYMYLRNNQPCNVSTFAVVRGMLLYLSYLVLFANFFYRTYISSVRKMKPSSIADGNSSKSKGQ